MSKAHMYILIMKEHGANERRAIFGECLCWRVYTLMNRQLMIPAMPSLGFHTGFWKMLISHKTFP
jgi:hypothetical protein